MSDLKYRKKILKNQENNNMVNINELNKEMTDEKKIVKILKESLIIVDKLTKMDADDIFANDDDREKLADLIDDAKKLTKSRLWKLK